MHYISIGIDQRHPRPWYLADESGNQVRDYSEYATKNGLAPVLHFRTREAAEKFAATIPPPAGCAWVDCDFSHSKEKKRSANRA